jgi:hypothetical protein
MVSSFMRDKLETINVGFCGMLEFRLENRFRSSRYWVNLFVNVNGWLLILQQTTLLPQPDPKIKSQASHI